MAFDFKKEFKALYFPGKTPSVVTVPPMQYVAVRGAGDPNAAGGAYQQAISVLYAVSYTIKMSHKGGRAISGFFDYVVPPLEGFWWRPDGSDDYTDKSAFHWISVIRLPDFVTNEDFQWAVAEASRKKKLDCSSAELFQLDEGLCVQMMHLGSYDSEPASIAQMNEFLAENGYQTDFSPARLHHEIYLSDPRKTPMDKRKTVLRHPIRKAGTL